MTLRLLRLTTTFCLLALPCVLTGCKEDAPSDDEEDDDDFTSAEGGLGTTGTGGGTMTTSLGGVTMGGSGTGGGATGSTSGGTPGDGGETEQGGESETSAGEGSVDEDSGDIEVPDVCLAVEANVEECGGAANGLAVYCAVLLASAAEYDLVDCLAAAEELFGCYAEGECEELAMDGACGAEQVAVDTACYYEYE